MKRQFKRNLTLAQIKKTSFDALYHRFILGETLNANEYETLLALAVCFLNADAVDVRRLGYRILVEYGNQTGDYAPLYEVAINQGLYPVSKFIEERYIADERRNFFHRMERRVRRALCFGRRVFNRRTTLARSILRRTKKRDRRRRRRANFLWKVRTHFVGG
jgi:hypothetical protein